jgi:glycosyltransferase involved in cell wall biosynthesis
MKKKIFLWTNDVEYLLPDEEKVHPVGGIQVQMYMWGLTLGNNGWKIYTFTNNFTQKNKQFLSIKFLYLPAQKYIKAILSIIYSLFYLAYYRPDIILLNGASRDILIVNLLSKFIKSKTIVMFASDSDLEPGKELIERELDKKLYRIGIRLTKNFIVQNSKQASFLKIFYHKENPLCIPLIWIDELNIKINDIKKDIILYVSNFRKLKRPKWFIQLAIDNPDLRFVMVGSNQEIDLYNECKEQASQVENLQFLGGLSFSKTNELFRSAKVFVCTSEIEGFPNTFPQAWLNGCPILTTFDPSDVIKNYKLGISCHHYEELVSGLKQFSDNSFISILQSNINEYYRNTFSAQMHYERLIDRFDLK